MKHLIKYKLFESIEIYGQTEGLINVDILYDVRDILLDLSDIGIECRMWVNGFEERGYSVDNYRQSDELEKIEIEVNHEGENIDLFNETVERLKDFLNTVGWVAEVERGAINVIKWPLYDYILIYPKGESFEREFTI